MTIPRPTASISSDELYRIANLPPEQAAQERLKQWETLLPPREPEPFPSLEHALAGRSLAEVFDGPSEDKVSATLPIVRPGQRRIVRPSN